MIAFIICLTMVIGLVKLTEKAIKEYDYGRLTIEEFEHVHKDSHYFK